MSQDNLTCISFGNDIDKCRSLVSVKRVSSMFSLIGCIYMTLVILINKKFVTLNFRLVLHLTIAACLSSLNFYISTTISDGLVCDFEGWFLTFTNWSVLLWATCITINLILTVKQKVIYYIEWLYYIICWILPFVLASLPFSLPNGYGPTGAWCWLTDTKWRLGLWYAPLITFILLICAMLIYITFMVNAKMDSWHGLYTLEQEVERHMMREDVKPLRTYACVFLCCTFFSIFARIHDMIYGEENANYFLYLIMVVFEPLKGALNVIVFAMNPLTRRQMSPRQLFYVIQHPKSLAEHGQDKYSIHFKSSSPQGENCTISTDQM